SGKRAETDPCAEFKCSVQNDCGVDLPPERQAVTENAERQAGRCVGSVPRPRPGGPADRRFEQATQGLDAAASPAARRFPRIAPARRPRKRPRPPVCPARNAQAGETVSGINHRVTEHTDKGSRQKPFFGLLSFSVCSVTLWFNLVTHPRIRSTNSRKCRCISAAGKFTRWPWPGSTHSNG